MSEIDTKNPPLAVIFGLAGTVLSDEEKAFFAKVNPLGFILFARNCDNPKQLRALTDSLRACMGRDVPILIDQEGGRVQRLKPPHWEQYEPARHFGDLFLRNFTQGRMELEKNMGTLARELFDAGINVNCAPVMDVRYPQTHAAIGDRSFSDDPEVVAALGTSVCRKMLESGIVPVVKHMPGLGRADLDTHKALPEVDTELKEMTQSDFAPFKDILTKAFSEAVWGMVSHALYKVVDDRTPASCSRRMIWDIIRQEIGFDGLLLSDDVSMDALEQYGGVAARVDKTLKAGCDVALHCNGDMKEMTDIAARTQKMTKDAVSRYNRSIAWVNRNFKHD